MTSCGRVNNDCNYCILTIIIVIIKEVSFLENVSVGGRSFFEPMRFEKMMCFWEDSLSVLCSRCQIASELRLGLQGSHHVFPIR